MVLLLLLLCAGGFGFYAADYYHADGSALAVLDESGITADDDTNTRWYDLNGMLLNGKP